MRIRTYSTMTALAAILCGLTAFNAVQANENEHGKKAEAHELAKLKQVVSVGKLIQKARAKYPGRVYGVEFEDWPEQAQENDGAEASENEAGEKSEAGEENEASKRNEVGERNETNERHVYEIQILGRDNKLHGVAYDATTGQFVGEHNEAKDEEDEEGY